MWVLSDLAMLENTDTGYCLASVRYTSRATFSSSRMYTRASASAGDNGDVAVTVVVMGPRVAAREASGSRATPPIRPVVTAAAPAMMAMNLGFMAISSVWLRCCPQRPGQRLHLLSPAPEEDL